MPTIAAATAIAFIVFPLTHTRVQMCRVCVHKCQCAAVYNCYTRGTGEERRATLANKSVVGMYQAATDECSKGKMHALRCNAETR